MIQQRLLRIRQIVDKNRIQKQLSKQQREDSVQQFISQKKCFIYGPQGCGRFIRSRYNDIVKHSDILAKSDYRIAPMFI